MKKEFTNVKIIGLGLAVLYAVSFLTFWYLSRDTSLRANQNLFAVLFGALFVSSLAVVTLKEWGRRLMVLMNLVMFVFLLIHYVLQVGLVPLANVFMTIIVLLYFNQSTIKLQFCKKNIGNWRSVLVVDDDETQVKLLRPILISYGFSVLGAATGEEGLQIAQSQKPSLVLLDIILPGIKGRDVCRRLKENPATQDIPVIFLTSKSRPEDLQAEKEAGGAEHLSKPVNEKTLISVIQKVLNS